MWNKATAHCPHCIAMDRERLYKPYIERETDLPIIARSVLHIAPEPNLRRYLSHLPGIDYVCGEVNPGNGMQYIDITAIPYDNDRFDVILCSHVLEHVPNDRLAMRELHRVLKPGGWGIVQVPIVLNLNRTYEDPTIVTPEARTWAFGQEDHVRLYAKDFVTRLEEAGFAVRRFHFAGEYGLADAMKYGLSEGDILYVVTKGAE